MKAQNEKLLKEGASHRKNCNLCTESLLKAGDNTGYGAVIYRIGSSKNGWFATLSPKTGGNPRLDFTIQIMPSMHLTHFSQMNQNQKLAENYGICFSKVCSAMTTRMMEDNPLRASAEKRELVVSIATYGKSTTWKEKKEHLHIKIFPFGGAIGQPYTVDSTFEKKEIFTEKNGNKFVKMLPVKKVMISRKRFNDLKKRLISLLN